ncbi:MAG: hypothetical protein WCL00_07515, partial [Bacteroidota bacterium]
ITPDNLKQVFDKWVAMIGREIRDVAEEDYALLFFADIMSDGTQTTNNDLPAQLLHKGSAPVFALAGKIYELSNKEGYRQFWAIYHKPPKAEYRNYLLERPDSLIPLDERSFKGAFYTPLAVVDKAYDKLAETLGENWQNQYIVWDMCSGVGNLEVKHSNPRNIYMSILDQADIDVMKATKTCVGAPDRFESDFMVQYMAGKCFSEEASRVLSAGKLLWQAYFAHTDVRAVRDELKLNRADVGWYQVRKALQARNASGDFPPVSFKPFEEAYKALTEKLQPKVYELGFLKA